MDLSESEELFHGLGQYAQKKLGFNKPPTLHLVSDGDNASKPLGKTAYYDPQGMAVKGTVYHGRRGGRRDSGASGDGIPWRDIGSV